MNVKTSDTPTALKASLYFTIQPCSFTTRWYKITVYKSVLSGRFVRGPVLLFEDQETSVVSGVVPCYLLM